MLADGFIRVCGETRTPSLALPPAPYLKGERGDYNIATRRKRQTKISRARKSERYLPRALLGPGTKAAQALRTGEHGLKAHALPASQQTKTSRARKSER